MNAVKSKFTSAIGLVPEVLASAIGGGFFGYAYGRLADLPAYRVAKAWAVWHAAQRAIISLTNFFIEKESSKALATTVISAITTTIGVNELRKRGFIGNKMLCFFIGVEVLSIYYFCEDIITSDI